MSERVDGEGRPYMTLSALMKREGHAGTGGQAKLRVRDGGILVNGVEETRPGRKLHEGDVVVVDGKTIHVTL